MVAVAAVFVHLAPLAVAPCAVELDELDEPAPDAIKPAGLVSGAFAVGLLAPRLQPAPVARRAKKNFPAPCLNHDSLEPVAPRLMSAKCPPPCAKCLKVGALLPNAMQRMNAAQALMAKRLLSGMNLSSAMSPLSAVIAARFLRCGVRRGAGCWSRFPKRARLRMVAMRMVATKFAGAHRPDAQETIWARPHCAHQGAANPSAACFARMSNRL